MLAVTRLATAVVFLLVADSLGTAAAPPPEKLPRVGYLSPGSPSNPARLRRFEAFRQALRERGYVEGQNIAIESRWAEGKYDRYPALAADLVRVKANVIVAVGGAATQAVQQATKTIPIVMSTVIDPVGSGLVASLARPQGNITGLSIMAPDIVGKQLQVLTEVVPKVSRVAVLWNPANPGSAPQLREAEAAARALGVQLQALEARVPQEIDSAFATMTRERAGALVILADAIFTNQRRQIAELAMKRHLPSVYGVREYAEAGGLMEYSVDALALEARAAIYVDKILKGMKPSDLPIEQPSKFELVINLKTAKAIGLTIPPSLLQRADRVIE
jgi:putative tryptophan/tyrosine transport system substrate-binding protein